MNPNKKYYLRAKIEQYNSAYRTGNTMISDDEYDKLVEELRTIDPDNDWFKRTEPVPVTNTRRVKLPIPMKSLEKVKSVDELKQWARYINSENELLVITPKFDGVSFLYDQKTKQAFSRGGAENEGQDCTEHAAKIGDTSRNALKPEIHYTFGELVFRVSAWNTYFKGGFSPSTGKPYRSPRNTIAGLINKGDVDPALSFATFYRYGADIDSLSHFDTYEEFYKYLSATCNQPLLMKTAYLDDLDEEMLRQCFIEWSRLFYIDGLVIYVNELDLWERIGRHPISLNPKYAIAYKNPRFSPNYETTAQGVSWKINKAGAFKPVVSIDMIDTGDCEMTGPTGYNARYVFENAIGKGAILSVTRSGGVIPTIVDVLEEADTEIMMQMRDDMMFCPHCGFPTTWNETGVELICANPKCPGIRFAKICHFYRTLNAELVGEETLSKIFHAGFDTLRRILDITFEELMRIDGIGYEIANVVLNANQKIRSGVEITKLMHASDCFKNIGEVKAKSILATFSDDDMFALLNGFYIMEDIDKIWTFKGVSKTQLAFKEGLIKFLDFQNENRLIGLPIKKVECEGDKFKGYKICFSGGRDKELEDEIVRQGGEVMSGVSKKTTHLVVASKNTTSTKAKKAKQLKIPIITIDELRAL